MPGIIAVGIALAALVCAGFPSYAAEQGAYRTLSKKTGKILWQASWTVSRAQENGKEIVTITEEGAG